MVKKLEFKKVTGEKISDVSEYVKNWIKLNPYCDIIIGCDSQKRSTYVKYAVTICMHKFDENGIGRGAHVIIAIVVDESKNIKTDLFSKLWAESELSIEAAKLIEHCGKKISIHLDYNSKEENYSHALYNAGIGYVKAFGFEARGKPFAPVATHIADTYCRK